MCDFQDGSVPHTGLFALDLSFLKGLHNTVVKEETLELAWQIHGMVLPLTVCDLRPVAYMLVLVLYAHCKAR